MKNILVTGGCGFIGQNLIQSLSKNYSVISIDTAPPPPFLKKMQNVMCVTKDLGTVDIGEFNDVYCVIHLAASAGVRIGEKNPGKYVQNNVTQTVSLLNQCVKHKIKNIIYASSSSVYGNTKGPHKESTCIDPSNITSVYGMTKYNCECYAEYYASKYDMNIMGLRFFTVYGEHGRLSMAVGAFTNAIMNNAELVVNGDGTKSRSFTYVGDVVKSIQLLINIIDSTCGHTTLNVGTPMNHKVSDVIDTIASVCHKDPIITYAADSPADVDTTLADITKLSELIGYHPDTSLEVGIKQYMEWLQRHNYFVKEVENHDFHSILVKKGSFPKGERDEPYQEYYCDGFWRPGQRSVVERANIMNFEPVEGDSVLELGSQMGGFLQLSLLKGASWVEGLDYDSDYVEISTQLTNNIKTEGQHVYITHGNMCDIPTLNNIKSRLPRSGLDHLLLPSLGKHVGGVKMLETIMNIFKAKRTYIETNAHTSEPDDYTCFISSRGGRLIGCTFDRNRRYVYLVSK